MKKENLKKLINVASGRLKADIVIKNCKIIDVFSHDIINGDIAICDDQIAGIGDYDGNEIIDAHGLYASPGFIESHIHIESSYLSPSELGRLLVPHGTTTIIADPHEIVNVCGITGLDYMMESAKGTALDIKFVLPSCVPATPFEHAGAILDSEKMKEPIKRENIIGLGEFMNFIGVINADDEVLNKLIVAKNEGKIIDGHSPQVYGKDLNAYSAARILADHECADVKEMQDRIQRGMYILLRQGSACHDLRPLLKGVNEKNSRRCLLCSDDRQPKTIFEEGHIDGHLKICVEEGLDAITAIQMATLNASECFRLYDRGAIAPGYRADIVLFEDLKNFKIKNVFIKGELVAQNEKYLKETKYYDISSVKGSVKVKDFSLDKLKIKLKSNKINVIELSKGSVVTKKVIETADIDENGEFIRNQNKDIVKMVVVERHNNTGNVASAFIKGYGIKSGAVALSISHDSHNIIAVGVNDEEIYFAVKSLIKQEGGIVLTKNNKIIESMPMPIAGLMSDKNGEWVNEKLQSIHEKAHEHLGISGDVEPVMTLCFMSLPVIPELKLTDMGLFDVKNSKFINIEAE